MSIFCVHLYSLQRTDGQTAQEKVSENHTTRSWQVMGLNLNHPLASSDRENGPQRHSAAVTLPSEFLESAPGASTEGYTALEREGGSGVGRDSSPGQSIIHGGHFLQETQLVLL